MDRCECCGQSKQSVSARKYIPDLIGYQAPAGQRGKFPMSADMCDECFEQAQIRGTEAYDWFSEKKRPPPDRLQ